MPGPARTRALVAAAFAAIALAAAPPPPAAAEVAEQGNLRVRLAGRIAPHVLPRRTPVPVRVSLSSTVSTLDGAPPPQLLSLRIAINRSGRIFDRGLPSCAARSIRDSPSADALAACGDALVGRGRVAVLVSLPGQSPYTVHARLLAFNARVGGHDGILSHLYADRPPSSLLMPLALRRLGGSTFGRALVVRLPNQARGWARLTRFDLTLGRTFESGGRRRGYLSAACPAPSVFPGAVFPLARATYRFAEGTALTARLSGNCRVR